MGFIGRVKRSARRTTAEFRDRFRMRRTEKPASVGYYKRREVLVAKIRQSAKKGAFVADFVHPRLGSALAPFHDHVYAPALGIAAQQVAVNCIKKSIENPRGHEILLTEIDSFKFRRKVLPGTKMWLELTEEKTQETTSTVLKTFLARVFVEGEKHPFTHGRFTLAVVPKQP